MPLADFHPNGHREEIHLPGPSLLPLVTAVGIVVALLGLIWSWWIVAAGAGLFLLSSLRWIRSAREDFANLSAEQR